MRESDLPSPGIGGKGYHLRRISVAAISQLEIAATGYGDGFHPAAGDLRAFFIASAAALEPLDADYVPPAP